MAAEPTGCTQQVALLRSVFVNMDAPAIATGVAAALLDPQNESQVAGQERGLVKFNEARSEWLVREAAMMDAINTAGRACMPVERVEQFRGLVLEKNARRLCCAVAKERAKDVPPSRVNRVAGVDNVGGSNVYTGGMSAVGNERPGEVGVGGRMAKCAGSAVRGSTPGAGQAVTRAEGGISGEADGFRLERGVQLQRAATRTGGGNSGRFPESLAGVLGRCRIYGKSGLLASSTPA